MKAVAHKIMYLLMTPQFKYTADEAKEQSSPSKQSPNYCNLKQLELGSRNLSALYTSEKIPFCQNYAPTKLLR